MDRREIIIPVGSLKQTREPGCSCLSITRAADFRPFKLLPADNSAPVFSNPHHFIDPLAFDVFTSQCFELLFPLKLSSSVD